MALAQASEDWAFDLSYGDDSDLTNFETVSAWNYALIEVD